MKKFVVENGKYVIYANDREEASQVFLKEMDRFDGIKEKMANLLSEDGAALQNFMNNTSEENLDIHFNDENSLIFDDPDNATTKGEVMTQKDSNGNAILDANGNFKYKLAYRYPELQGQNADFRLAHEMGHLMLNPDNTNRYVLDKETNTRHVSGLIRVVENDRHNEYYGKEIQENAINLIAQLAIRGEHSADDIMTGKVDLSEFNLYKQCDDLVKLLAVSMRNDFDNEMNFEQLAEQKIDSFIEHSDGTKEPANTFFYGILNDSSMIENEFDKYMGKGAWRDLDSAITQLHSPSISREKHANIYQAAQGLIAEFANMRIQEKYKEAVARDGNSVPSIDNKIATINEMTGIKERQDKSTAQFPEGYSINEFGEVIRPNGIETNIQFDDNIPIFTPPNNETQQKQNNLSFKQRIAQFLQKNNLFMNLSFVDKFVHQQLDVLPPPTQDTKLHGGIINQSRVDFMNEISNFGAYRNLPPIKRMSDPERLARMQRKMEQNQQSNDENERG